MITILFLHKRGLATRDVYGAASPAFASMRVGDVFTYGDDHGAYDGSYIITKRDVSINRARTTIYLHATECAPADEVIS